MLIAFNDLFVRRVDRVDERDHFHDALRIAIEVCLCQVEEHEIVKSIEIASYRSALLEVERVHELGYDCLSFAEKAAELCDVVGFEAGFGLLEEFNCPFVHH